MLVIGSFVCMCCSVSNQSVYNQWYYAGAGASHVSVLMAGTSNDGLVTVDSGGCVRLWETAVFNLTKSLSQWRSMIGDTSLQQNLQVQSSHSVVNYITYYVMCELQFAIVAGP